MATSMIEWLEVYERKGKNMYFYKNSRIYKSYIPDPWDVWMGYKIKNGKMYRVGINGSCIRS